MKRSIVFCFGSSASRWRRARPDGCGNPGTGSATAPLTRTDGQDDKSVISACYGSDMTPTRRHPYVHLHADWRRITRAELLADGIVHAIGIVIAITAGAVLLWLAAGRTAVAEYIATIFYVVSLLTVLSVSCAYNLWPASRAKWFLRRLDHSAIYLLIAGTYTPFTLVGLRGAVGWWLFGAIWALALAGVVFKLFYTGRFRRLSTLIYLAMGWLVVVAAGPLLRALDAATLGWLLAGGVAYTLGTLFYLRPRMRWSHAIWHGFVIAGSVCHYISVMHHLL